ncbi:sugar efflux transporter [Bacillus sp. JCM 19041]|uniref:sugar efflux transporter n=1 Tax=Bacillus sp. JCM 19041 TaxID=1460637 RepID=UPI000B16126C
MLKRFKDLFVIKGFGLFIVCMLLIGTSISITMPYLSLYGTEVLGMSTAAFGVFMAVTSLAGVLANTFIAAYSDSGVDRKWLIVAALFSSAVGYGSYLLFENFFFLLLSVSFFNGFGAAAMPQIFAYAQESANESKSDDKTFAKSTLRSLVSLGFLIGPLLGTLLLATLGYVGLFLATSMIFLTIATLVIFFLKNRKMPEGQGAAKKKTSIASLRHKGIALPFIAFIFLFAVNAINGINTPLFIVNVLGGSHADVGLVVSICAGLEIPIMLFFGSLGKRISNHRFILLGCVVAAIYFVGLAFATASWQLIVAQLFQATLVAVLMGNGLSYFSDLIPTSPGIAATVYSNGSTLGRLVGSLSSGFIAQIAGFRFVNWVCVVMVAVAFILLQKTTAAKEVQHPEMEKQSI